MIVELTKNRIGILKLLPIALMAIGNFMILSAQKTYYVSLSGDDDNSGLSQSKPWRTIPYAASSKSPVKPGDTVFIKAGDYSNENVVFERNGRANKQITFEGYSSIPGDAPKLNWEYGDGLNPDKMPLLDGNNRTSGIGISLHNRKYINIRNCVAVNMKINGYELRYRGVKNNLIENCKAINCGYSIRDGASYNTIRNCTSDGAASSILFFDTTEDEGAQYAGRFNVFENCVFRNSKENAIKFFHYNPATMSIVDNNTFMNCVFDGGEFLINADRENVDNKMVNCIVTNVKNYSRSTFFSVNPFEVNFDFEFTNFWNNGFEAPQGVSITPFDPNFVDLKNGDYHLTETSPCIGIGTLKNAPQIDFDGQKRNKEQIDLGPFMFKGTNKTQEK
ncbi:hypothetical protein J0656_02270 [Muricauda ruestringensis]|uniref:Right handed beta helix domain-containing protein n=1 Tax=Flagellimonas aurea TaxID=2915619 RepID=A0ABS3G1B2_9FLAO|nr:right-handed parallel beta-helix repeat-containing protein [Allomuricauda aurea]MAO15877.1 hypothetical protein [Allomuricauda sp.]MBO0352824.1 hypothetical protein [Allomuricauda aurea]